MEVFWDGDGVTPPPGVNRLKTLPSVVLRTWAVIRDEKYNCLSVIKTKQFELEENTLRERKHSRSRSYKRAQ